MYIPEYFKNKDLEEVKDFLKQNSFGILITNKNNRSYGTHIPLELEKDITLTLRLKKVHKMCQG